MHLTDRLRILPILSVLSLLQYFSLLAFQLIFYVFDAWESALEVCRIDL